MKSPNKSLLL